MDLPLVVGVDGSEPSLRAVDWAADEAALRGVPLRLVHASLWEPYEGPDLSPDIGRDAAEGAGGDIAEEIAGAAARRAQRRQPDVKVSVDVVPEEPVTALVHEGRNASAIVLGHRGRSGIAELLLGSVSLGVAGHADCPVVVLRGDSGPERSTMRGRIVVGVGADPARSANAVRLAADEAAERRVPLEAVRAWRRPAHRTTGHPLLTGDPARHQEQEAALALEEALRHVPADVDVRRRTPEGPAHRALLDASAGADLLVVGARRRQGHVGLQLGRVAHTVLHHAACPVAVVPERA